MSDPYVGAIFLFAGTFAPLGYQFCNGQTLAISQNTALFSLLGTTYGGNGTSTFALPDLRGRAPIGQGQGPGLSTIVLGQSGGSELATLSISNLPSHSHSINAVANAGASTTPAGNFPAIGGKPEYYSTASSNTTMSSSMVGLAGGSTPLSILPPYLTVTYIIAIMGVYPTRS
jgi:microcystin-dependent protein